MSQDGTLMHNDNVHGPPPNYDVFMISSPDHLFFPVCLYIKNIMLGTCLTIFTQITKQMFRDLHQVVFSIVILHAWTLVPTILKAEAGRHIRMVAFKNNLASKL
jgi:hypothetical protein